MRYDRLSADFVRPELLKLDWLIVELDQLLLLREQGVLDNLNRPTVQTLQGMLDEPSHLDRCHPLPKHVVDIFSLDEFFNLCKDPRVDLFCGMSHRSTIQKS